MSSAPSYTSPVEVIPGTPYGLLSVAGVRMVIPQYLAASAPSTYHCLLHQLQTQADSVRFYNHPAWLEVGALKLSMPYTEQGTRKRILATLVRTDAITAPEVADVRGYLGSMNAPYEAFIASVEQRDEREDDAQLLVYLSEEEVSELKAALVTSAPQG